MGKARNSRFVSFSDKATLKQLLTGVKPVSDQAEVESLEELGEP
jgi:hypothetical protein